MGWINKEATDYAYYTNFISLIKHNLRRYKYTPREVIEKELGLKIKTNDTENTPKGTELLVDRTLDKEPKQPQKKNPRSKEQNPNFFNSTRKANLKGRNGAVRKMARKVIANERKLMLAVTFTQKENFLPLKERHDRAIEKLSRIKAKCGNEFDFVYTPEIETTDIEKAKADSGKGVNFNIHGILITDNPKALSKIRKQWGYGEVYAKPFDRKKLASGVPKYLNYMSKNIKILKELDFMGTNYFRETKGLKKYSKFYELSEEELTELFTTLAVVLSANKMLDVETQQYKIQDKIHYMYSFRIPKNFEERCSASDVKVIKKIFRRIDEVMGNFEKT